MYLSKLFILFTIFITISCKDNSELSEKFTKESIKVQIEVAKSVLTVLKKDVYLFDLSKKFKNAAVKVLEPHYYRYLEAINGDVGVLSMTAQITFPSTEDFMQFVDVPNQKLKVTEEYIILIYNENKVVIV